MPSKRPISISPTRRRKGNTVAKEDERLGKIIEELKAKLVEFENSPGGHALGLYLDLSLILCEQLIIKGWTVEQLAREVGFKPDYVEGLLHADEDCMLRDVGILCFALDVEIELRVKT